MLIALHACDTATDDALWSGMARNANVIVVAPCCHREVRPQLNQHATTSNDDHPLRRRTVPQYLSRAHSGNSDRLVAGSLARTDGVHGVIL
jgi:hypothetical protein